MTQYATWTGYSRKKDVSLFPHVENKEIVPDLELLQELVKHRSASFSEEQDVFIEWLIKYIETNIPEVEVETDKSGNIYLTKGEADLYPCIVAHVDCNITETIKNVVMLQAGQWLIGIDLETGEQTNPAFDDKVGVLFVLQMLKKFSILKCLLTSDEEAGGIGAYASDKTFFKDCTMIAQLDRNAYAGPEFISYSGGIEMCSEEFMQAASSVFEKYGYFDSTGMFTDANCIKSSGEVDCIAFNSCAAYFDEHCDNEVCYIPALENAFNFVYELIRDYGATKWYHKSEKKGYGKPFGCFKGDKGEWEDEGKVYRDWEDWEEIDELKQKNKSKLKAATGEPWVNGVNYMADRDLDYTEAQDMIDIDFCPNCEAEGHLTVDIDGLAYCSQCTAYFNIPEWYAEGQM